MDAVPSISVQDIANIISFIAPGYFATATYSLRFAKSERSFSIVVVESIAWSLPLVAATNLIWEKLLNKHPVNSINTTYALLLLIVSILAGFIFTELRVKWPVKNIALRMGLASPDEDFLRSHFGKLSRSEAVTVELKSGKQFSGAPSGGSNHSKNGPRRYCFNDIWWYDKDKDAWIVNEKDESLVVDLAEVEYIITPMPKTRRRTGLALNKRITKAIKNQWQILG